MHNKLHSEGGNILMSALLVMLAMNLLAIGLVQNSVKEFSVANFKTIDATTFYLAETCVQDSVSWFKTLDRPPENLPYTITRNNLNHLYSGEESQEMLNSLSKYSYNCVMTNITAKSVSASETGYGENIGSNDGYGISGDLRPKYYYQVQSTGSGPQSTKKQVYTIVSVEY